MIEFFIALCNVVIVLIGGGIVIGALAFIIMECLPRDEAQPLPWEDDSDI